MKLGADPKKVSILGGLLAVAGIVYWMNSSDSPPSRPSARSSATDPVAATTTPVDATGKVLKRREASGRPKLGDRALEPPKTVDPTRIDPTLRFDLLAKVQAIEFQGANRDLFNYGEPPKEPDVTAANGGKIPDVGKVKVGAQSPPPPVQASLTPPKPPGPPPTPPINLKYYGYSTKHTDGEKKAFFLDGDDIIVASEGEIIKKQYKVVRIGNNSVQMEDTASKSTQTLPIQPDATQA